MGELTILDIENIYIAIIGNTAGPLLPDGDVNMNH